MDHFTFMYRHLAENPFPVHDIFPWQQNLAGGGSKHKEYTYPLEDITIFYIIMAAHVVAFIFLLISEIQKHYSGGIYIGALSNLFCTQVNRNRLFRLTVFSQQNQPAIFYLG